MSSDSASVTMDRCDCHEWHRVADIGEWMVRRGNELTPVRAWLETGGIWRPGHCEIPHEELTAHIQAAGGITCDHALEATLLLSGGIELVNGMHRWTVTAELGIETVTQQILQFRRAMLAAPLALAASAPLPHAGERAGSREL